MNFEEVKKYLDKEVKIYSIQKFIDEYLKNNKDKFQSQEELAIFETKGKGLIVDYEAVGQIFNNLNDEINISLTKIIEEIKTDNSVIHELSLGYSIDIPIKTILENAEHKTMKIKDFFTRYNYNSRCIENFAEMIKTLNDIKYFEEV